MRGVLDGDAPSFEAACKLAALFVVAEGGSPGPLCHAPPRGCSCQVAGSSEPLSHPRPPAQWSACRFSTEGAL